MMNAFLLAQAQTAHSSQDIHAEALNFFWQQITDLSWLHAVIAISVGVVYMLYGWRIFRILVVISFGLLGMFLGIYAGRNFGSAIWGGIIGLVVLAIVSIPLMKWCVSLLGAAAGGVLTGGLWYAFALPLDYIWAGTIIGVVAGGLISFILLKVSVMLFTGLGGSAILMVGVLALLYQYETQMVTPPTQHVHGYVFGHQWFLPLVIIVPTIIGMIVQNRFIKQSQEWEI
jgi:hypothetical protein